MQLTYRYLYTRFSVFGSLPTHKIYKCETSYTAKLIFADNTFIYGLVTEWMLQNTDFYSGKPTWQEESAIFLAKELQALKFYRLKHPLFQTESQIEYQGV